VFDRLDAKAAAGKESKLIEVQPVGDGAYG
jgi:hypothetical protein